jgi:hypothetical protein
MNDASEHAGNGSGVWVTSRAPVVENGGADKFDGAGRRKLAQDVRKIMAEVETQGIGKGSDGCGKLCQ